MSTRRLPPDASGGDWQVLLESNYHHLCRSIRPDAFFSWLRSKGVFTSEDQEEIENKYVTTVMKSGHLIDKVKMKGDRGFKAFMEVVEYVYPDTFNLLTGFNPRKPPSDFEPNAHIDSRVLREKRGPALSAEILGQMGELVNVLSQANACKKEELNKLQTYVRTLQQENETMCEENRSILQKLKDAQEEIEQLKQKLSAQQFKSEHDSKERKAIIKECERIRELKDKYMDECQRLRQDRDDLDCRMMQQLTEREMHRSKTCRMPVVSQLEQVREENRLLILEREKMLANIAGLQDRLCEQNTEDKDKVSTAKGQAERLAQVNSLPMTNDQRILELEQTRDELDLKSKEWQNKFTMLQERYDYVLINLEELKTERNQMHSQLEDLQSMYDKETEENKRLVADCDKYQDRFCDMESQMTSLKMELQSMQASLCSSSPTPAVKKFCDLHTMHNGSRTNAGLEVASSKTVDNKSSGTQTGRNKGNRRPIEKIKQTPGLCPDLSRQVVVKEIQKTNSFSSA